MAHSDSQRSPHPSFVDPNDRTLSVPQYEGEQRTQLGKACGAVHLPVCQHWRGPCANRVRAALPSFDEQIAYSWVRQTRDTGLATLTSLDPQYPDLYEPECSIRHLRTSNRNFPSSSSPWSSRANHFVNTSGAQACDMQTSHMFKVGQTDDTELTLVSRLPAAIFNWPTRSLCPSYAG